MGSVRQTALPLFIHSKSGVRIARVQIMHLRQWKRLQMLARVSVAILWGFPLHFSTGVISLPFATLFEHGSDPLLAIEEPMNR